MHCKSCEILIEEELLKISGVTKTEVSHTTGEAKIYCQSKFDQQALKQAIEKAGYHLGHEDLSLISTTLNDYKDLGIALFIVVSVYLTARGLGIFNVHIANSGNYSNLLIVLLVGLTAGISTCMALVGGLVLGASARYTKAHPDTTGIQKFTPHLFFNLGRIISFVILGGIIGAIGSIFQLSITTLGIMTLVVGIIMLLLGGQMVEMFPVLKGFSLTLPKQLSNIFGTRDRKYYQYSRTNSMILGALTFFLPCGFTQAMQFYAISTGNPVSGALTMGTFALGTTPGLLGIGGITALVKGPTSRIFYKTIGVVLITLAVFNLNNGLNLLGVKSRVADFLSVFVAPPKVRTSNITESAVRLNNGVQEVTMKQTAGGYFPGNFTIRKGILVRWIINSEDSTSCASSIYSQKLGIRKNLVGGENIIEFTPTELGTIPFSCSMGMFTGSFNVIADSK